MQPTSNHLSLGSAHFTVDPLGALYWPEKRLLIVADLHLEKGSAYAARKIFLPPYDTSTTLATLAALIARHAPRRVLALGDSFHDGEAGDRVLAKDRAALAALQSRREWIWLSGNHDPELPSDLGGDCCSEIMIGGIEFRHAADPDYEDHEIAGHLHPVARVVGSAGSVRRRCFVSDGRRCILPALGAYAGGLNLRDAAFAALFARGARSEQIHAHVLGRDRVYKVSHRRCLPD
ncbi:MAG: ligase-associated DNA damage response endonuclease PdeM [Methylovirgula sp.]